MNKARLELETPRLLLRQWKSSDVDGFAKLNADPIVMENFPAPLSYEETAASVERIKAFWKEKGFGLYAAELKNSSSFIGFIGLSSPRWESHFTPCVEIGWRLAKEFWGNGYAPEGALEVLRFAFDDLKLEEVVSMTSTTNVNSMRVMEKIGMHRSVADDFDHPTIAEGSPLRRHVLYRLKEHEYRANLAK